MSHLPLFALSVRQPWAWAIIHAGKDIENRSWQACNHGLNRRGRIAVHAAKTMTRDEYETAAKFMRTIDVEAPPAIALERGGIIGSIEVVEVVREHSSRWFFGPRGLVLRDPQACEFIPAVGELGYFQWRAARNLTRPKSARWMIASTPAALRPTSLQTDLFIQ